MKIRLITLSALSFITTLSWGQTLLYNDGATVKIQAGATLYVEGGVHNTSTGMFDNDGTLEVKGNFLNQGSWDAANPNILKFSGDANSDVTSGSAQFQTVVIAKGNTYNVNLLDNMTVNTNLDFAGTNNKLSLGNFNLTIGGSATVTGYDSDEYVMTGGTGVMKKSFTSLSSFLFPVGYDGVSYNPATLNVTAGPNDIYSVRVGAAPTDGDGLTGAPITSDVVNVVWDVDETTAGGNTYGITLGWGEPEELTGFNDALNAVSINDGTNGWDALFTDLGPEVGNTRTRNGLTSFGAFSVGGEPLANKFLLTSKVFLQGPYSAGSMLDDLRAGGHLPTAEPYSAAPYNYTHTGYGGGETVPGASTFDQTGTNDDIVDWIVIEIRSSATPATILASKTALLQRDGDIVDLDGASTLALHGLADGTYHVGIKHRNHLPVRTNASLSLSGVAASLDFTVPGVAYDNGSPDNEPMIDLGSGVYGMWAGDVDNSNVIEYAIGDRLAILNKVGSSSPSALINGYHAEDLTMNGVVEYALGDRLFLLQNVVGSSTPSKLITAHQ